MHECLLCKKDMKTSRDTFGNGCIKNIYSILGMRMPRKVKLREPTLHNNIMILTNTIGINNRQKIWLTDRFLTNQFLKRIPYGNFNSIKRLIDNDIKNIKQLKRDEEPKSAKRLGLKQAYDIYKKATRFTKGIDKLKKGDFSDEESIRVIISSLSFIFNIGRNSSQYEKDSFKAMQFVFWQTVIEIGGKYVGFDISADFLQHSLEEEPTDLLIKDGKVIEEIRKDLKFQKNINDILNKYSNSSYNFIFDSYIDKNFPMRFSESDLYFSLNKVSLYVTGKKQENEWVLNVKLHDRYDYSDFKDFIKYYKDTSSIPKSVLSSTLYNLAWLSIKCDVMKEYDIDIEFKMNSNFEVIDS